MESRTWTPLPESWAEGLERTGHGWAQKAMLQGSLGWSRLAVSSHLRRVGPCQHPAAKQAGLGEGGTRGGALLSQ